MRWLRWFRRDGSGNHIDYTPVASLSVPVDTLFRTTGGATTLFRVRSSDGKSRSMCLPVPGSWPPHPTPRRAEFSGISLNPKSRQTDTANVPGGRQAKTVLFRDTSIDQLHRPGTGVNCLQMLTVKKVKSFLVTKTLVRAVLQCIGSPNLVASDYDLARQVRLPPDANTVRLKPDWPVGL